MIEGAHNLPAAELFDGQEEKPQDECGVWGVYAPGMPVAAMSCDALARMQHRGQSGAGVFVYTPYGFPVGTKGVGMVPGALRAAIPRNADTLSTFDSAYQSDIAVGHVRYSTAPGDEFDAVQPMANSYTGVVISHNGHLSGMDQLYKDYNIDPAYAVSDSHGAACVINELTTTTGSLEAALCEALPRFGGAGCFSISDGQHLYGSRDAQGYHPLVIGQLPDSAGFVLASETVALDTVGATLVRDVEPGEIVRLGADGVTSIYTSPEQARAACRFEYIYTADRDSVLDGASVGAARVNMGRFLAIDAPADADVVVHVPDSGKDGATGYATEARLPMAEGLIKNPKSPRSFLLRAEERAAALRGKFSTNDALIDGRRLVVVDDSIIKGNSMLTIVGLLRAAGAREVHVRSTAPRYEYPCYMGMDTGNPEELIARTMTDEQIARHIGADSVAFNSGERVDQAIVEAAVVQNARSLKMGEFCTACATGKYPAESRTPVLLGLPTVRTPTHAA